MWVTDGALFVEGLMAVFTTVATWCAYRYRTAPSRKWVVWMGVLIALAALTRGEAVLLVVLLMVPIVLRTPRLSWPQRWKHTAIGLAAFVATLAPWMIYNAPRFNVFVPLSTNSNEVLFYANCDDAYYGSFIGFWSFACQERYRAEFGNPPGDQAEQSVFWRSRAIEYMKAHSDRLPRVIVARVARQWELFRPWQTADFAFIEGRPATAVQIGQDMFYVMMLLAVPGSFALRRRRTPSWPLWSHAVAVTLTAAYAYGTLRFRAPFEPILCVLAAIGGVALFDAARARVHARRQGGTPAVAH
jgi:4-amino-4-deoxy-L-arabinose transferase-like glycosyltransferase